MTTTYLAKPAVLPPADTKYLVVEASAGTGKTFFLEHRVVDLLINQQALLPQIVVVTFTEKATAELRRRIRNIVDTVERCNQTTPPDGPHWVITPEVRAHLARARADFGQAAISTIHGFCQKVLLDDAFLAGRMFEQQRVTDEVAFEGAFYAVLREQLAVEPAERDLLYAYLAAGHTVEQLASLLLACHRRSDVHQGALPSDEALLAAAQTIVDALRHGQAGALLDAPNANTRRTRAEYYAELLGWLEQGLPRGVLGVLEAIDTAHASTKAASPSKLDLNPAASPLHQALATLYHAPRTAAFLATRWLPRIAARVSQDKAAKALFDYHDLLAQTWDALEGPRGEQLAAAMRRRLPWAMIDEFQDTDQLQWNIFSKIWLHPDARGLAVVGDPKQSIYSFRGADVDVYLAACAQLAQAGALALPLQTNFRASDNMVDAVNMVLVGDPLNAFFAKDVQYTHPTTGSGQVVPAVAGPSLHVTRVPKRDGLRRWCNVLCDEIVNLLRDPLRWHERGHAKVLTAHDIMVITRSGREGDEVAAALAARGIASVRVLQERLFTTREASELLDLLVAIARPRDRQARLRALRTRFFAVPWQSLAAVVEAADSHPSFLLLTKWQELAVARQFDQLFVSVVQDSGLALRTVGLAGSTRALVNTQHLLDLLAERAAAAPVDFAELVDLLSSLVSGNSNNRLDELDTQRVETDADAVQIFTAHRSKGLEAAVVFWYGGFLPPPKNVISVYRQGAERKLAIGQQPKSVKEQIADDVDQENRRLMYVAMTRAKLRLYMPLGDFPNGTYGPVGARLQALAALAGKHNAVDQLMSFTDAATVAASDGDEEPSDEGQAVTGTSLGAPLLAALGQFTAPAMPTVAGALDRRPATPAARQMRGELLSYSRLAKRSAATTEVVADEAGILSRQALLADGDDDDRAPVVLPDEHLPPGADSGLYVHALLEHADYHALAATTLPGWLADPAVMAWATGLAQQHGIARRDHIRHGLTLAHATVTTPWQVNGDDPAQVLPPLAAALRVAREVEFMFPAADDNKQVLVRGALDALVQWQPDEVWIVDYKSDTLVDNGALFAAAQDKVASKYKLQAALYAMAVTRMLPPGTRLRGMLYVFVRYGVVVQADVTAQDLQAAQAWLEPSV